MEASGELIAQGRDGAVYDHGPGLVMRKMFDGRSIAHEARVMEHVRSCGVPVPKVHEVSDDGTQLVMDRIDGPTMADHLMRHPWEIARQARAVADLHHQLHELPSPDWLQTLVPPTAADGDAVSIDDRILHLDLHPLNIMISPGGPVLIDWTNAKGGAPGVDLAQTWLLMAVADPGGVNRVEAAAVGLFRKVLVREFLKHIDRSDATAHLAHAIELRGADRNTTPAEVEAMRQLSAKVLKS